MTDIQSIIFMPDVLFHDNFSYVQTTKFLFSFYVCKDSKEGSLDYRLEYFGAKFDTIIAH